MVEKGSNFFLATWNSQPGFVVTGVAFWIATSVLIIIQYIENNNNISNSTVHQLSLGVLILHFACSLLVAFESFASKLGGRKWAYSAFVIASGWLATLTEVVLASAVIVQFPTTYLWATAVLPLQVFSNSLMVAYLFSKIPIYGDTQVNNSGSVITLSGF